MKKIILFSLIVLVFTEIYAQRKTKYTNFADTTFIIDEVVVEAKQDKRPGIIKLGVPAKHLPLSVSMLDAKNLEIRGIQDLEEAIRFIPGLRMSTQYGSYHSLVSRGFSGTPIMVDGVRDDRSVINTNPFPDLSAVESVELLKGPASVLYGHSAVGGILNIIRKSPSSEGTVNSRISYGSYENKRATVGMGGRLVGPVNYYSSINFHDQEGWRDNNNRKFSGYIALGAKLSENDNLDVRAGFNRDSYGGETGLPDIMPADIFSDNGKLYLKKGAMLPGVDRENRYNNDSDFQNHDGWNVSATYTHKFNKDLRLENKTYFTDDDLDYLLTEGLNYLESDSPIYDHYYMKSDAKKYINLDSVKLSTPLAFAHRTKTVGNQLDLIGKFTTGSIIHNYMVGYTFSAMFRDSYTGYKEDDVWGPGVGSIVSSYKPESMGYILRKFSNANIRQYYTHSVYLQDLIELSDSWKVLLSGRYDNYKYNAASAPALNGKREYEKSERSDFNSIVNNAFSYRAGLVYLPSQSLSFYASMGSFFKPNRTVYSDVTIYVDKDGKEFFPTENEQVFKPESGYQTEVGTQYTFNTLFSVNASFFYIRRENAAISLGSKVPVVEENGEIIEKSIRGQVGVMDSKGFDVELVFTPFKTLFFTAAYAYTDARIRDVANVKEEWLLPYINDGLDNTSGNYQSNVPKSTFFCLADYTIPKGIFKDLGFLMSTNYMSKVYRNTSNTTYYDPYWLADLGIFYSLPKNNVKLSFNLNNVFDKEYANQGGNQTVPSMPRNFQVSLSYKL